ncbi:MAG: DUF4926 domain-containing protein [Alphaproteobacteria bacterium]|nr:DUF4926 domain-containing protein [Alphaproteobacteria bacterium]MCB9974517.1 DUF4926 domain-containing protein [Rhodospirillales bacterium]
MKVDDIITLKEDLPEHSLIKGKHGFIVEVYEEPEPCCKVEFLDRAGHTLVQIVLNPSQFKIMWSD